MKATERAGYPRTRAAGRFLSVTIASVRLIHPFPSATVVATTAILMLIAHRGLPAWSVMVRGLAVIAASQVAVGALNDYLDREDDARMQPDKPLAAGLTTPAIARTMVWIAAPACLCLALTFGPLPFAVAAVGLSSGLVYDLGLKRTPFSPAAYVVSFLSLVTLVWLIAGHPTWTMLLVYPVGACLLVAAHLANALPDVESDRELGQRGLAVVLGARRTFRTLVAICMAVGVLAAGFCLVTRSFAGLALVLASLALTLAAAWTGRGDRLHRPRRKVVFRLTAPAIGLLAGGCLLAFVSVT